MPFSLAILIGLFALQRFGTGAVGGLFGPIMVVWFLVLGALGAKEVAAHPGIIRALSPTYAGQFLADDPKMGFFALGSVFLAVTGAEAIYADMGHFGRQAITRAWLLLAFPALLLNYMGQGALILAHPATIVNPFFFLVPGGQTGQKAMVVLATIATVIASQAVISGAFSVTQQVIQLGFLPRMSIRHTSKKIIGQIYIPIVNWLLLFAVIVLVLTFRSPTGLANAYGIALSAIFASNTFLAFVVFRTLWRKPLKVVIPGAAFFISVELTFFAANLTKILSGGWFPLVVGAVFFTILTTWHRGRITLARAMREGRVSLRRYINRMIDDPPNRIPGSAVFLTTSLDTVPTALLNNAEHNGIVHEQVVLVKVDTVAVPHVDEADARLDRDAPARIRRDHRDLRLPGRARRRGGAGAGQAAGPRDRPRPHVLLRRPCDDPAHRPRPHGRRGASASSRSCTRTRSRSPAGTASRPTACSRSARTSSSEDPRRRPGG